jgi:hypothetical protein
VYLLGFTALILMSWHFMIESASLSSSPGISF